MYFVELSVRWPCSSFYCRGPSSLSRLLASLLPPPGGSDCVIPETVGREGGPLSSVSPLPPSSCTPTHCQYLITGRRRLPPFSSRLCCSKKKESRTEGKRTFFCCLFLLSYLHCESLPPPKKKVCDSFPPHPISWSGRWEKPIRAGDGETKINSPFTGRRNNNEEGSRVIVAVA